MNTSRSGKRAVCPTILLMLLASATFAASVISTISGGSLRTSSANYTMDTSIGGISGISGGLGDTNKSGYIGQLYEVVGLVVTAAPNPVSEDSNALLSATATLDDATVLALAGTNVVWSSAGIPYPLSGISGSGVASATNVYQNTQVTVNGYYRGATSNTTLLVLDTNPDNYGSYAGDGIPDSWQVQYFGQPPNADAAPGVDADGTGQNTLFKYIAGLDPTNPASVFVLRITVAGGLTNLIYNPIATGRT